MAVATGVGAGGDGHAQLEGPPHAGQVMLVQGERPSPDVGSLALAVVDVHEEGGHDERTLPGHPVQEVRVLVEVAPVLDRIDAGLDRRP